MSVSLTINGVQLHTLAWNVQNRGSRWQMPGRRGENFSMPGVHGSTYSSIKPYEENSLTLSMWAVGANTDGTLPADKDAERKCLENLDMLSRLFSAPVLDVRQTLNDGSVRQCYAEVVQAVDFSSMAGGSRAEFAVELSVPAAFWFDVSNTTQTLLTGAVTAKTLAFTSFSAATAPLTGLVFEVTGPVASPVLADPVTGQWVKLTRTLTAGQVWKVDTANWATTVAGANALHQTSHGLGTTFLDLSADATGPKIYFTAAGSATTATSVKVTGKKAYFLA